MGSFLFDGSLSPTTAALLVLAMAIALAFEFVNGFHDTANAVATVIYTRSMARKAVAWSGFCNFLGVYLGGTAVAFSILNLLPVELLVSRNVNGGLAMVLALLTAAITWNLWTWWMAIPASSSHTLIGAILGVGMANALLEGRPFGSGVNWEKVGEVGASLMISPLVGFTCAGTLLLMMRRTVPHPPLYEPAATDAPPPAWVRGTLLATCTGVSFAHGSNDGQKGIGLLMLILVGVVPAHFALNPDHDPQAAARVLAADEIVLKVLAREVPEKERAELETELEAVRGALTGKRSLQEVPLSERWALRTQLFKIDKSLARLLKNPPASMTPDELASVKKARADLSGTIYYAPTWVLVAVATSLGCGTMIGWQRIVTTVGEKIGKSHLSYAQGAAAELVAAGTISLADLGGLPVSTTHVLSSGVAGTMAANRSGLQLQTIRTIAMAWVLTLPVSMALSGLLFVLFRVALGVGRY
ncbi:MAG: inorganic phosphate transporter [Isosphaeraceae bacterium]